MSQMKTSIFTILGMILLMTTPVLGESAAAHSQPTQTLTQGNIESNILIAPDYKFTEIDGDFGGLAGWSVQGRDEMEGQEVGKSQVSANMRIEVVYPTARLNAYNA